jgi:hypothetical protein
MTGLFAVETRVDIPVEDEDAPTRGYRLLCRAA